MLKYYYFNDEGKNICLNNKARKEKIGPIIPWNEEQKGNISVERMNQQKKEVKKKKKKWNKGSER